MVHSSPINISSTMPENKASSAPDRDPELEPVYWCGEAFSLCFVSLVSMALFGVILFILTPVWTSAYYLDLTPTPKPQHVASSREQQLAFNCTYTLMFTSTYPKIIHNCPNVFGFYLESEYYLGREFVDDTINFPVGGCGSSLFEIKKVCELEMTETRLKDRCQVSSNWARASEPCLSSDSYLWNRIVAHSIFNQSKGMVPGIRCSTTALSKPIPEKTCCSEPSLPTYLQEKSKRDMNLFGATFITEDVTQTIPWAVGETLRILNFPKTSRTLMQERFQLMEETRKNLCECLTPASVVRNEGPFRIVTIYKVDQDCTKKLQVQWDPTWVNTTGQYSSIKSELEESSQEGNWTDYVSSLGGFHCDHLA